MLPAVIPRVRVRWNRMKNKMQGRTPSKAEELDVVTSMLCWPCRVAIAIGTVWFALETSMTNGRKNSFQVQIKKKTNSTERVGMLIGKMIFVSS